MTAVLTVACDAGYRWQDGPIESYLSDPSALMARVQRGDQAAFADLYDAIASVVHGVVLRVLRDPTQSEEVTQEVFVELWSTAARFDPTRASVTTWAVTIARRRAIDRVRKEQSQRDRVEQLGRRRAETSSPVDDDVVASLDAERVNQALSELPRDQRQVIELAFLEGWSHSAIATSLGLPLGTVKGRVRSGLQRLGSRLGGHS